MRVGLRPQFSVKRMYFYTCHLTQDSPQLEAARMLEPKLEEKWVLFKIIDKR